MNAVSLPDGVEGTVLLQGIVGSTAYGLAHAASDVDRLGMFAAPTVALHGLGKLEDTHATTGPDSTLHEAGKYARLALGCNPTAIELMWLPGYEVTGHLGQYLIDIRAAFLSAPRVKAAYFGYAGQQFYRLHERNTNFSSDTKNRTAKHARHLLRLLIQGLELYQIGRLRLRLHDGEVSTVRHFGEQVAAGNIDLASQTLTRYEAAYEEARTSLPDRPDEDRVERWLRSVRHVHYTWPGP